ncbi:MAG TPA: glycosyltransferase family 39 protein [Polyangia bacterium]|nr:glycosyltransferase family 39 protein [Polyangia bacterium]
MTDAATAPALAVAEAAGRSSWARACVRVLGLALVVRVAIFPFAENKHGDAPVRALIAQRLVLEPGVAADPRTFCQFGPLQPLLMAPFVRFGDLSRSSRYLSFVAGLGVFWPFLRLARRLAGPRAAELAGLALAASPLHVQASTTAASEALYLLLLVWMFERLMTALCDEGGSPRTFATAGALAALAALTRYDAWVALPVTLAAAWLFARGPAGPARRRRARGLALFAALTAVAPVAWMAWGGARTDDPIFFFHYISSDHAQLGASAVARYGAVLARARQLGVWALAFVAAMTPPLALALVVAARRARWARAAPAARVVVVAALAPVALYLAQGLVRLSFEPLPRFALVPGALLLPFAAAVVPAARLAAARVAIPLGGAVFAIAVFAIALCHGPRIWGGAESNGALTRLDDEDRALAAYLRAHRPRGERVMIEPFNYADIAITEAAGVPATESITLAVSRAPRATVAETLRATGARWMAVHVDDRPDGWLTRFPDWPRDALAIGRWRLVTPPPPQPR